MASAVPGAAVHGPSSLCAGGAAQHAVELPLLAQHEQHLHRPQPRSTNLTNRALQYMQFINKTQLGLSFDDMFKHLPVSLSREVIISLVVPPLLKNPFVTREKKSKGFIGRALALALFFRVTSVMCVQHLQPISRHI